jgi:hypothetical protein
VLIDHPTIRSIDRIDEPSQRNKKGNGLTVALLKKVMIEGNLLSGPHTQKAARERRGFL